jgi:circadian clock protein KaiB
MNLENGKEMRHMLVLRLYIAGRGPNSARAIANLQDISEEMSLDGLEWDIELVDVLDEPLRALEDGILVSPTLVKLAPPPRTVMVGNLDDRDSVLQALGREIRDASWAPAGREGK